MYTSHGSQIKQEARTGGVVVNNQQWALIAVYCPACIHVRLT